MSCVRALGSRAFHSSSRRLSHCLWRWGGKPGGRASVGGGQPDGFSMPTKIEGFTDVNSVECLATANEHSAFVCGGHLYTFGNNRYGQLGRMSAGDWDSEPGPVNMQDHQVKHVSLGDYHTVLTTSDGAVYSMGWGGSWWSGGGGLGLGDKEGRTEPDLVHAPSLAADLADNADQIITQVACGGTHTVLLAQSGKVFATGNGEYGKLGVGESGDELSPVEVEFFSTLLLGRGDEKIVSVHCGTNFSAALSNFGQLYVWGKNDQGQLGLGEESMGDMHSAERYPRTIPSFSRSNTKLRLIATGEAQMVAVEEAGVVFFWGNRSWLEPHSVTLASKYEGGIKDIKKVVAGSKVCLLLTESGLVYSWGKKSSGCLGRDKPRTSISPELIPPEVFDNQKVLDISCSRGRALAVTSTREFVALTEADVERLKAQEKYGNVKIELKE